MDEETKNVDPVNEQESGAKAEEKAQETKTFTQEDVNGLVAKEAKKAQEKLFKQLGLGEDIKSVQDGLKKYNEYLDSQKTEVEKANETAGKAAKEKEEIENKLSILQMENVCLKCGVAPDNVEDVALLAKRFIDDKTDGKAAITKVLEKYPHFKNEAERTNPKKPVFSTTMQKSNANPSAIDEVRKMIGLKN